MATIQGDRARFKERLEYVADAMGLEMGSSSLQHPPLTATYPEHWVERIVVEIGKVLLEEDGTN